MFEHLTFMLKSVRAYIFSEARFRPIKKDATTVASASCLTALKCPTSPWFNTVQNRTCS